MNDSSPLCTCMGPCQHVVPLRQSEGRRGKPRDGFWTKETFRDRRSFCIIFILNGIDFREIYIKEIKERNMLGRNVWLCLMVVALFLSLDVTTAKKEFTRKQVGSFFHQYPRMERLIFKAIKSEKNAEKGTSSRAAPDPNNCPQGTDKCCFSFGSQNQCYCCS